MPDLIVRGSLAVLRPLRHVEWLGPFIVRIFFGYFWLETGWAKLHNLAGFTARFVDWGIPFPALSAGMSAGVEFVGGGLIMLGLATRLTSIAMIVNMLVAIGLVVITNVHAFDDFVELDEFVYILIFFWLLMAGPGQASVDAWLARRLGIVPVAGRRIEPRGAHAGAALHAARG
jgi:putative oxidoreductase